jgi:hypothetical protein
MQIFRISLRETEGYSHLWSCQVEIVTLNKSKNKLHNQVKYKLFHMFLIGGVWPPTEVANTGTANAELVKMN